MQTEEVLEEIIVLGKPWYSALSGDDWVMLAVTAIALTIGVLSWRRLKEGLLRKLVLAGVSGLLCNVVFHYGFEGPWPESLFFFVSGGLFAAGVLFPYLRHDRSIWFRGFGLIAISTLSYWSAIETYSHTNTPMFTMDTRAYLAASLVGAFIVLTGARFITPLNRSMSLALVGVPAAIVGGLAFTLIDLLSGFFVFSVWHGLMAFAIHIAENWRWQTVNIE